MYKVLLKMIFTFGSLREFRVQNQDAMHLPLHEKRSKVIMSKKKKEIHICSNSHPNRCFDEMAIEKPQHFKTIEKK